MLARTRVSLNAAVLSLFWALIAMYFFLPVLDLQLAYLKVFDKPAYVYKVYDTSMQVLGYTKTRLMDHGLDAQLADTFALPTVALTALLSLTVIIAAFGESNANIKLFARWQSCTIIAHMLAGLAGTTFVCGMHATTAGDTVIILVSKFLWLMLLCAAYVTWILRR